MTRQKRDLATVISSSRVAEGSLSPNAAACDLTEQPGSSTSRTARRESKRNEAAQLAQELATSGSWSEAFSPRTYGTIASPQNGIQIARDSTRLVSDSAESQPANMTYQDFDPPPAYSKRADIHELPVDGSSSASLPSEEPLLAQGADSEQESEGERTNDEEARTFLGRRRCRHHSKRDWTPWIRKGKGLARKRVRLLLLMLLLAVVGSAISCIVYRSSLRSKDEDDFLPFPSRPSQTIIPIGSCYEKHETTREITGLYQLQERVELTTTTGFIDVEIDPQPGAEPAYLLLASNTGRVKLRLSPAFLSKKQVPSRAIFTEIRTETGAVSAEILLGHGGYATVETVTGQQHLSVLLYDVGPEEAVSNITTSSRTGQQKIVLQPLVPSTEAITNIHAKHRGTATAALDIEYPSKWMGEIYALASPLGNVEIDGSELEFIRYTEHEKMAYRGADSSRHKVEAISIGTGSVSFMC